MKNCPLCGGGERLGVWFHKTTLPVIDKIIRAGEEGVDWRAFGLKYFCIRSRIQRVRNTLEETDWDVAGEPGKPDSRYRLLKRRP